MTNHDRRRFLKHTGTVATAGLLGLAGCSGGPEGEDETTTAGDGAGDGSDDGDGSSDGDGTDGDGTDGDGMDGDGSEDTTTTTEGMDGGETTHVGIVYGTGGTGDGSFNDQALEGVQRAAEELPVEFNQAEPDEVAQFSNFQQQFASSSDPDYDLISCIGFLQADALGETASNYSDQDFQIVDGVVESDNVASYLFREQEGSYLVGVMAGMLTTQDFAAGAGSTAGDSTNVGFVGGIEGDVISRFEAGFKAGVKDTASDVDIQTTYVGDFNDPSGGKSAALSMYSSGSDIVYHAAGNTGTGVFRAAQEEGKFAIGVDRDQSVTKSGFADVILASMTKRVDTAVFEATKATVEDDFPGGSITSLGLAEEGVDAVYGQQLGSEIPQDVKDAVSAAREGIVGGDISVPEDPGNV
jgi:basic membrane protein A